MQEQIEEENSDPDEEEDQSDFEREALENEMSPKKRHYSRHTGNGGSGSSSAEAKSSSEQSRMTSGFAPPAGVDQGTGVEDGIEV